MWRRRAGCCRRGGGSPSTRGARASARAVGTVVGRRGSRAGAIGPLCTHVRAAVGTCCVNKLCRELTFSGERARKIHLGPSYRYKMQANAYFWEDLFAHPAAGGRAQPRPTHSKGRRRARSAPAAAAGRIKPGKNTRHGAPHLVGSAAASGRTARPPAAARSRRPRPRNRPVKKVCETAHRGVAATQRTLGRRG